MNALRTRLGAYAIALLVCQAAVLIAAPFAVCRITMSKAIDVTCPMHPKTNGGARRQDAAWRCVCPPADAALLSLLGVTGTLPAPVLTVDSGNRFELVVSLVSRIGDRAQTPRAPPPRS
jgi:hypothetical protein